MDIVARPSTQRSKRPRATRSVITLHQTLDRDECDMRRMKTGCDGRENAWLTSRLRPVQVDPE
jgi:hypothetical protein